ncbi:hypothetical protein IJ096_02270 [Candidatus Saccharibacteria bacterium]|nr:hypothetical protein [Candidatus Saccharibacteria bacterium]
MKITNKIKTLVMSAVLVSAGVLGLSLPASAVTCPDGSVISGTDLSRCGDESGKRLGGSNNENNLMSTLNVIINVVIGIIGFLAVAMIIYCGIQYTMSAGAADKVKSAKDTIMYGIIGLIVALLAFAIVNFVLSNVFK